METDVTIWLESLIFLLFHTYTKSLRQGVRITTLKSAPTIPPSPDYTPASPDYSPASETEFDPSEDPSSGHIPPLPVISPFLSSDDDTTNNDTPDTPPSPTHGTLFTEITASIQRSPVIPHRRVMILAHGQPIPHGRPYRYHPNGPTLIVDLIPPPKRVRDIGYLSDVEVGPRETRVERVTHPAMPEDIPEPAREGAADVTTVGVESAVTALTERVAEFERDNRRLRGIASVESQRVNRLQRDMKMPNTRSGGSMTHEEVEELVARRVAKEMEAREAARNLETPNENEEEQEGENGGNKGNENGDNGGNKNGGNDRNGNGDDGGNGNHGMNYGGFMPMARECTFQDFLKCKPYTFSGTEGIVGLTRWFEKIETVFNISNCPPKYQVKYATCTLQNSALTWWNSHKRTIGVDAAYAMKWAGLMKLMTEVHYPRNEVQKMNIQRNVIAANPTRLQDAIHIANQLMDKKLQGYAARSVENKRRMESNPRDKRGQQSSFKRQNTTGQNVARAYTTGNNERKGSFVSTTFSALLDVSPSTLDTSHPFNIDLMPVKLGCFDVIIGMDWLAKYHALIVCDKKVVRIPYRDEVLIIRGDNYDGESKLNIISCTKTHKYIQKGCQVYLAQVTSKKAKDKSEEKRLEDVPIVREFPEVFPEDLPGFPPARQDEFQIDLVPGAAPVARAPYRLAPTEMQQLSTQLQELSDRGFIRPSSSPWGAPILFVKKKDGSFWMCIDYRELNNLR
nr:putative reverse transcriptase domain-containing protein [Tanacetum cinerariifolium]